MKLKLIIFAVGAFLLVIGDYLYGTTYYTNQPTEDVDRFMYSAILGLVTTGCYLYGLFGYADGFIDSHHFLRKLTIGGLFVFSIGVAGTHSIAAGSMFTMNQMLLSPENLELQQVLESIENTFNLILIMSLLGLLVGFTSLGIAILRNQTVFSKKALFFFPLLWAILIMVADSSIKGFPILLKSVAWSGVIFNSALLLFKKA